MEKIFTSTDAMQIEFLKELLEEEGIKCSIGNQSIYSPHMSMDGSGLELWVYQDEDIPKALILIEMMTDSTNSPGKPWICPHCGEEVEGHFDLCWSCGKEKDEN